MFSSELEARLVDLEVILGWDLRARELVPSTPREPGEGRFISLGFLMGWKWSIGSSRLANGCKRRKHVPSS